MACAASENDLSSRLCARPNAQIPEEVRAFIAAQLTACDRQRSSFAKSADSFGLESLFERGFRPPFAPETALDEPRCRNVYSNAG